MNKVAKLSTLLVAILLMSVYTVNQLSAQAVSVTLDRDFVSNSTPAATTTVITITDAGRSGTILADQLEVENLDGVAGQNIINLTSTETGTGTGVFTALLTVTDVTTTAPNIRAADGDEIQVTYTTTAGGQINARTPDGNTVVIVDASGPTISNTSPPHEFVDNSQGQLLQAEVTDSASGMGADADAVEANVVLEVDGVQLLPVAVALNDEETEWRVSVTPSLSAGTHNWRVIANDGLGNQTISDSVEDDEDDPDTLGDQLFSLEIDTTEPRLVDTGANIVTTGDTADTDADPVAIDASGDRNSIRIGFDDSLDGASVASDGSDFRVLLDDVDLTITSADWYEDIPEHVFLTLSDTLAADETPLVRLVGSVDDEAGNTNSTGEVEAVDGISPELTVTINGEAFDADTVTDETMVVRVSADEDSDNPTISTAIEVRLLSGGVPPLATTAERASDFETVTDGTTWEWIFEFTETELGAYNVFVTITDTGGDNDGTSGLAVADFDSASDDAILFEVDTGIPDVVVVPEASDDPDSFINLGFTYEGEEYEGDTHNTVVVTSVLIDDVAVPADEIDSIDDITFTIAPQNLSVDEHEVDVTVEDTAGNEETFTVTIEITERAAIEVTLRPGLNLISIPGTPASTDINDVIPEDHPINQVLTYDPQVAGGWLVAERGDDGLFAGTLTTIDATKAYFVRTTTFESLDADIPRLSVGERVLPPTISLTEGWNLVPVVDVTGDLEAGEVIIAGDYFGEIAPARVYGLDQFGTLETMNVATGELVVGGGYWVYVTDDEVLIP